MKDIDQILADNLNRNVLIDDEWRKSLLLRALEFAIKVHGNQIRKGDGKPYIVHPIGVALIVAKVIPNDFVIAAALLHDTVEDTDTTLKDIQVKFNNTIAKIVEDVTEKDKNCPWKQRKLEAIAHIKNMDEWSLIVKSADKLHNLKSLYALLLEKGEEAMGKFNAPLKEQLEMDHLLYEALESKWSKNPLLHELKETIEDIEKTKKRQDLVKGSK